jgi:signal peptidase I
LPGDKIVLLPDGGVSLNGTELDETYVNSNNGTQPLLPIGDGTSSPSELDSGTCLSGTSAATAWTIGPGQVFVMGDHRDVSLDSRAFGPIAQSVIIGRVWLRLSGEGGFGGFNRAFWDGQSPIYYGPPAAATPVPPLPPAAKPNN